MNNKILKIAAIGIFASLAYIAFTFLQIKIPTPGGTTSFHLGNTFVLLAALLIGGLPGGLAGAIGMGIGDLLDPIYVTYAPKTIILKLCIGLVTGFLAHKIFKISEKEGKSLQLSVILATCGGMLFNIIGEPLFGYFYNAIILGVPDKAAKTLAKWNGITTSTNAILSIVIASIIYLAIYKRLKNSGLLDKLLK